MITVEHIDVWGFEHAVRGMRNPMNSWNKSDSKYLAIGKRYDEVDFVIGSNDLELMRKLFKAGTEHRKYMRQIFVSLDITAPLYWWKEFDTYKIGTVANSCSTMHKIQAKEFTLEDFSVEHLTADSITALKNVIYELNRNRVNFNATHEKKYWWQMIQLLPTSFNQRRTITMNYENAATIIKQRTGHKQDEWNLFIDQLWKLPYIREITKD